VAANPPRQDRHDPRDHDRRTHAQCTDLRTGGRPGESAGQRHQQGQRGRGAQYPLDVVIVAVLAAGKIPEQVGGLDADGQQRGDQREPTWPTAAGT
jgi:hypothetical protein